MNMQQTITEGAPVYGIDGEKVGTVAAMAGAYMVVEKGFFFPKDYYIPVSAITENDQNGVFLTVTKEEALHQGWDHMPTEPADTGAYAQMGTQTYDEAAGATAADQDVMRVPVHEEHLEATTRPTQTGEVTINKHVVTEQETVEVPVSEERVRVAWRAPTGEVTDDGQTFEEGAIEIPVSRDVVDVSKHTVQTGELDVTKERTQRTQKVTDSVRREVVDVDDPTGQVVDKKQKR